MTSPITINASTPFLLNTPSSQVSPVWIRFLTQVVTIITNSSNGLNLDDIETLLLTSRSIVDPTPVNDLQSIQASLRQQFSTNVALALRVAQLESLLSSRTVRATDVPAQYDRRAVDIQSLTRRIEELEEIACRRPTIGEYLYLQVQGGFGCNGQTPQLAYTLAPDATDLATAITLVNDIKTMAKANGIGA